MRTHQIVGVAVLVVFWLRVVWVLRQGRKADDAIRGVGHEALIAEALELEPLVNERNLARGESTDE
jgi:hypothetical protein